MLNSVGPVKIIKKTIPGCFFKRGKSTKAFLKQKGVKIIKAITHLLKDNDSGDTNSSTEDNLPTIKLPDQNKEAKHKNTAALRETLT